MDCLGPLCRFGPRLGHSDAGHVCALGTWIAPDLWSRLVADFASRATCGLPSRPRSTRPGQSRRAVARFGAGVVRARPGRIRATGHVGPQAPRSPCVQLAGARRAKRRARHLTRSVRRLTNHPRVPLLDPAEAVPAPRQRDRCFDGAHATRTAEPEPDRRCVGLVLGSPVPVNDIPVDLELELVLLIRKQCAIGPASMHRRGPDHAAVMSTVRQWIPAEHLDGFGGAPCHERELVAHRRRGLGSSANSIGRRRRSRSGRFREHGSRRRAQRGLPVRLRAGRSPCGPIARQRREREGQDHGNPGLRHVHCLREPCQILPCRSGEAPCPSGWEPPKPHARHSGGRYASGETTLRRQVAAAAPRS